ARICACPRPVLRPGPHRPADAPRRVLDAARCSAHKDHHDRLGRRSEWMMPALLRVIASAALAAPFVAFSDTAFAGLGQPSPWEIGLQHSASPVMDSLVSFHNFLLVIITLISIFVLGLLVVVIFKFNARANPTPTKTTHNTLLEVLWTVVPVV